MTAEPIFEDAGPPGFLSQAGRSRYMALVGSLGAVNFLVQMVVPVVIILPAMFRMMQAMSPMNTATSEIAKAVFWDDRVWLPEHGSWDVPLVSFDPADGWRREEQLRVHSDDPHLIPDGERLWVIGSETYGVFEEGDFLELGIPESLQDISSAFLYDGSPAVLVEETGKPAASPTVMERHAVWRLTDEGWQRLGRLALSDASPQGAAWFWLDSVQAVSAGGRVHLFVSDRQTLYHREGLAFRDDDEDDEEAASPNGTAGPSSDNGNEAASAWTQAASLNYGKWVVTVIDDEPAVFHAPQVAFGEKLIGLRYRNGRWEEFLSHPLGMATEFGVCDLPEPGRFAVLVERFPSGMRILEVEDGRVAADARVGGEQAGAESLVRPFLIANAVPPAVMLVTFLIVAWSMGRYRTREYRPDHRPGTPRTGVEFASLMRRGIARTVDTVLVSLPLLPMSLRMTSELLSELSFELFFDPVQFGRLMAYLAASMGVWLLSLVVFSVLEGRWGRTPGKWLAGIQVVGTDLRPCGFGRALVRNLLLIADGFFNYLVGLLTIAFTDKWQRVGDLAAGTIVIRRGRPA